MLLLLEKKIPNQTKVTKPDKKKQPAKKIKAKGLVVLSEVALTKAEQLKLATKKSKKDFHMSYASGVGDGFDTQSKVPDEQQQKSSGTDEGTGTIPGEEEEENIDDEETMYNDEDDEVTKELYEGVNVNLGNKADEPVQSSSISSDFRSKLLNLENPSPADNEIALLMETSDHHATEIPENTSSFTTTILPPPPFFNPLEQEATPTPTPTTSETTTSLPALPDFTYVFKFNERVFNLEKDVSKIKQVDQYAQALSSIPAIVDRYMDNKLEEAINNAILAHNLDYRQEAQDEKIAYIELVDTSMRALIKEEVNTQHPQILPQAVLDFATLLI
ncbi:hypothetical protein Tco_1557637 [Tanacetum coccineum]